MVLLNGQTGKKKKNWTRILNLSASSQTFFVPNGRFTFFRLHPTKESLLLTSILCFGFSGPMLCNFFRSVGKDRLKF